MGAQSSSVAQVVGPRAGAEGDADVAASGPSLRARDLQDDEDNERRSAIVTATPSRSMRGLYRVGLPLPPLAPFFTHLRALTSAV
jgi:hypothetical protein